MSRKVAIVTGANKGIGFAIVKEMCKQFDGEVYLTSRDEGRGIAAVRLLNEEGLQPKFHLLDIDSIESINRFKNFIKTNHGGLDVLINNAGIAYWYPNTVTFEEQAETTIRVNFFGTMNVCDALLPLLRPHGRVVTISSSLGVLKKINGKEPYSTELQKRFSNPNLSREELVTLVNDFVRLAKSGTHFEHGWSKSPYVVSKVGLVSLTRIQQREMDESQPESDILFNAVHPGYCRTDMTSNKGNMTKEEGAVSTLWLALIPPNSNTPKGGFVWSDKKIVNWVDGPIPNYK